MWTKGWRVNVEVEAEREKATEKGGRRRGDKKRTRIKEMIRWEKLRVK